MGEAKRKRDRGIDMARTASEIVDALNTAAGAVVWFNVRRNPRDDYSRLEHIYYIANSGEELKVASTSDVDDKGDYRDVLVALLHNGGPWIATRIIDQNPNSRPELYGELGAWASDIATPKVNDQSRVPTGSFVLHTDWPDIDTSHFDRDE